MAGYELATAYVNLTVGTDTIAKQIGGAFKFGEKTAAESGKRMGQQFAKAFEGENPIDLQASADKAARNVEAAARRVEKARLAEAIAAKAVTAASQKVQDARSKEQGASRKVEIAEQKLSELRESGTAKASQLLAAEDRVASAKEAVARAARNVEAAEDRLARAKDSAALASQGVEQAIKDETRAKKESEAASASLARAQADTATAAQRTGREFVSLKDRIRAAFSGNFKTAFAKMPQDADKAADKIERRFIRAGDESAGAFSGAFAGAFSGLLTYVSFDAIGSQLVSAITASGALEQSIGGIQSVFKSSSAEMLRWSETAATAVGLSKNEYNELGTLLGAQLKNAGASMSELAPKTNELITLGADLASMFGGTTREAVEAISSALKGERDPIERYGVSLRQSAIDAKAAELGFKKVGGSFDQEAQAAATLALIMEQTADAHGNFARESGTFAHQHQVLAAQWENLKATIAEAFLPALTRAFTFLNSTAIPALSVFGQWVRDNAAWLKPLAFAIGAMAAVWGAYALSVGIATLAMRAWGVALLVTPLGWIATAVGALTGVLVWFFTQTEWGRQVWTAAWNGIKTVISAVATWFITYVWPSMKLVIDGLGAAFTWLYQNVILPVWSGIRAVIGASWAFIRPVFEFIVDAIKSYLIVHFQALWTVAKIVWSGISFAIGAAWAVIKVAWDAIAWYLKNVLRAQFQFLRSVVQVVWNAIAAIIKWAWNTVIKPIWQALVGYLQNTLGPVFTWLYNNVIKPVWNGIKSTISTVWYFIRDNVFGPLANAVKSTLPAAFRAGKDAIGKAWDGLRDVAKKPVRFVIDTVINNGIIAGWNKIARTFKAKEIDPIALPKGFARGGWTGPGARLKEAGIVHADEFVIKKSSRRRFERDNPGVLDHINRTGTLPMFGGYAGGGMVWQNLWGIVKKQFPWARLTSAYRPGSITASGNRSYHSRGMAVDLAGVRSMDTSGMMKIFNFLRDNYAQSAEIIYSPAGGRQIKNGRNHNYTGAVRRMHFNHVHWANRTAFGGPTAGVAGGGDGYDLSSFLGPFEALKDKIASGIKNAGEWGELIKAGAQRIVEMPITWLKENAMKFIDVVGDVYSTAKNVAATGTAKAQGRAWAAANGVKWSDLNYIVSRESGWNPKAKNPRSSAAGLPQFITANQRHYGVYPITSKSVSEQLSAMHKYVHDRHGGWSGAVSYWKRNNHYDIGGRVVPTLYDQGGALQPGTTLVTNKTRKPEYILPAKVTDSLMRGGVASGDTWNIYGPDANQVAYEVERRRRVRDLLQVI